MTLENIVDGLRDSAKGFAFVAAGLASYATPASAQEPSWLSGVNSQSVCSERYETLFSSGSESLDQVTPIGLQDCSSLENHFDENLNDSNPLVVSLDGDQTYDFATLRSLAGESTQGEYTVVALDEGGVQIPLPDWVDFDSEYGVSSASPSCDDQGSYLLEFNVAPGEGPGSVNPLFVQYDVSCPSTLSVEGLDFEGDGQVTSWPYHGTWSFDAGSVPTVFVREGKGSPYEAWVRTDKSSVSLTPRSSLPDYVTLAGDRIDFHPPLGFEGDSGTLELLVCDSASPGDCRDLDVPYEVVDRLPEIVGLSYTQQNGTIDNPVEASGFALENEVACDIAGFDRRYVVSRYYDVDQSYQIINEGPGMGISPDSGSIATNPDCQNVGQSYFPSVRVVSNSGSSNYKTAWYTITNGVGAQSFGKGFK